jgi:hypothetical protein
MECDSVVSSSCESSFEIQKINIDIPIYVVNKEENHADRIRFR